MYLFPPINYFNSWENQEQTRKVAWNLTFNWSTLPFPNTWEITKGESHIKGDMAIFFLALVAEGWQTGEVKLRQHWNWYSSFCMSWWGKQAAFEWLHFSACEIRKCVWICMLRSTKKGNLVVVLRFTLVEFFFSITSNICSLLSLVENIRRLFCIQIQLSQYLPTTTLNYPDHIYEQLEIQRA